MGLFKSKKFWMALVGVFAVVLSHFFGLSEDQIMSIAGVIIAYLLGQGLADQGKEAKKVE